MSTTAYATALAWQEALTSGDIDTLLELSSDGIEIAGDHGGGQGLAVLNRWASESHTTMTPERVFMRGDLVVSESVASGSATPGEAPDSRTIAAAFQITGDQVGSVFVHPDLASAFAATGLGDGDLVED
ncbi:nuclear transport factor 2 family protein [Tomitella fengzijianii]|uniref:nuclear transport factor 2 family protein n=1 Tax=Tomitella fengzijianii TaxID=2597660 RepID=UPI00131E7C33|nr:nuclear transport factor 2 family protein [Tomitella fengzijianii]